jgi:hypothetical protein
MPPRDRMLKLRIRAPKRGNKLFTCVCRLVILGSDVPMPMQTTCPKYNYIRCLRHALTAFTTRYLVTKSTINQSRVFRYSEDQAGFLQGLPPMCSTP